MSNNRQNGFRPVCLCVSRLLYIETTMYTMFGHSNVQFSEHSARRGRMCVFFTCIETRSVPRAVRTHGKITFGLVEFRG